jgi:hypothetical protein
VQVLLYTICILTVFTCMSALKKKTRISDRDSKRKKLEVQVSTVTFADVGGNESTLKVWLYCFSYTISNFLLTKNILTFDVFK